MRLSIPDRLILPTLCKRQGDINEMALLRDVATKVQLPADLLQDLNFHEAASCPACNRPTMTVWDFEKAKTLILEIPFSKAELDYLKGQVQQVTKERRVTLETLDLCLRINAAEVTTESGGSSGAPSHI